MENGVSIFLIMHLLGHTNIQTTMMYLHLRDVRIQNIPSPIDLLEVDQKNEVEIQRDLFAESA